MVGLVVMWLLVWLNCIKKKEIIFWERDQSKYCNSG